MDKKWGVVILLLLGGFYLYSRHRTPKEVWDTSASAPLLAAKVSPKNIAPTNSSPTAAAPVKELPKAEAHSVQKISKTESQTSKEHALNYVLDEGVAVVQGDLVVGEIVDDDGSPSGLVKAPSIRLWPSRVIPFYIQPNLKEPERVMQALALFTNTAIQFVPYSDQDNVLVFEDSTGICKSYVGMIGGKQPLWVSPGCEATEIAHEIMHALGFVHEQNRTDRDQYIEMFPDNIEDQYKDNFFRLPDDMMKVSGLAPFDFESLMMYPPTMFSKNGQATMRSKIQGQDIHPDSGPSPRDIERMNKVYGQ